MFDQQLYGPTTFHTREVPLNAKLGCYFGGFLNQFGWIFFGFGMIFAWIFALRGDFSSWDPTLNENATATGIVSHVEKTGYSIGGSETSDGTPVYSYHFRFQYLDKEFTGVSYETGHSLNPGHHVVLRFPADQPQRARVRSMRRNVFGPEIVFVVLFPLVGFGILLYGLKVGHRANRLLRQGVITTGKLINKERTNMQVNNRHVYKLTFTFQTEDGRTYQAYGKTHEPERLEDEPEERLIYNPAMPSEAMMIDTLPGQPKFSYSGNIESGGRGYILAIIPGASILGHGAYLLSILT